MALCKLVLAKTIFAFDLSLPSTVPEGWMDQRAFLVFEPKDLFIKLVEKKTVV